MSASLQKATKVTKSAIGGPSQLNQSSRKGKRAWRKNIDIQDVESALEEQREEERIIGAPLQSQADSELFHVDKTGDEQIRKSISKQLTSTKILSQRSAVPAVLSRAVSSSVKRKAPSPTKEEKERLLRISKRPRKGPFNSIQDHTEFGAGSAVLELSEAVKNSGEYDVWSTTHSRIVTRKDGLGTVRKSKAGAPQTAKVRDLIQAPAVPAPHLGASYNPPADAHQELLLQAHKEEERRVAEADALAETKKKFDAARIVSVDDGPPTTAAGMSLDEITVDHPNEGNPEDASPPMQVPARKTKQQRQRAAKALAEKRALEESKRQRRLHSSVNEAKNVSRRIARLTAAREAGLEQRKLALREKIKRGLGGQKLGKHKVPVAEIDVQLEDDLSESLRGLKPEGNLFKDRFLSMQQRALVEPRNRILPTRRIRKVKVYEKHAWKRFT